MLKWIIGHTVWWDKTNLNSNRREQITCLNTNQKVPICSIGFDEICSFLDDFLLVRRNANIILESTVRLSYRVWILKRKITNLRFLAIVLRPRIYRAKWDLNFKTLTTFNTSLRVSKNFRASGLPEKSNCLKKKKHAWNRIITRQNHVWTISLVSKMGHFALFKNFA